MNESSTPQQGVAIIGAGPAGLIAAETLAAAGIKVTLYDRMPSAGRKLLMAGRGGLNLTHSEDFAALTGRYGPAAPWLQPLLEAFPPSALIEWAQGLGQETFIGSSGRIFPRSLKASPLLRAWLGRLADHGVTLAPRHDWAGWTEDGRLTFRAEGREVTVAPDATILALGGASWSRLGSNGAWVDILSARGVDIAPLRPANCGFDVAWSDIFDDRFAGTPLKNIAVTCDGRTARGEALVTSYGIEGGVIYAIGAAARDAIDRDGKAVLEIDLRPDMSRASIADRLHKAPRSQSTANLLRKTLSLPPVAINLLREAHGVDLPTAPGALASLIKSSPITLTAAQPIDRAISTAGGVSLAALDETLMLRDIPGVFVAGEMLDWEAPTGGYLLQACFATGIAAAHGVLRRLGR